MPQGSTILILDNDTAFAALVRRSLAETDICEIISGDPTKAGDFVAEYQPFLVFIDPAIIEWPKVVQEIPTSDYLRGVVALIDSDQMRCAMRKVGIGSLDRRNGISSLTHAIRFFSNLPAPISADAERILVTDDDEDIRRTLLEFLRSRGYAVFAAENGNQAIDVVDLDPALRVVLLDVIMPEGAGIDALVEIMKRNPRPSVVMMSSLADHHIAQQAVKLGALDYIRKPFDLGVVESAVVAGSADFEYREKSSLSRFLKKLF